MAKKGAADDETDILAVLREPLTDVLYQYTSMAPTPEKESSLGAVEALLRAHGQKADVSCSDIPYRHW